MDNKQLLFERVKLGDLFPITSGGTPSKKHSEYYENGNIPWVKTGDLKSKYLQNIESSITEDGLRNSSARVYDKNTVLLAMYGATIGATSILTTKACTNQACAAFEENENVLPEYLYYFLKSKQQTFIKDGIGGAQPNISAGYLRKTLFQMRTLECQASIVSRLASTERLIALRQQQLTALDTLVKARFVEMFGDPVSNPMGWPTKPLLDMGYCKNGMNFHTDDNGFEIHCLGVGDFKDFSIINRTDRLSLVSLNEQPPAEYLLQDDDIVFVRSNGNKALVGRCLAVYPNDVPTTYSGFCIRYRRTGAELTTAYLLRVLKTETIRKKMAGRGANIQNLNQQILAALSIPIPPMKLQQQFSAFIAQIDKSKAVIQRSLDKLQVLFDSLMQEYFG